MLTQLATVKQRLGISEIDVQYDAVLTTAIQALSARFDKECNRTLARTVDATHEFPADDTEILPSCYPIESVTKFELKENETDGWVAQTGVLSAHQSINPSIHQSKSPVDFGLRTFIGLQAAPAVAE